MRVGVAVRVKVRILVKVSPTTGRGWCSGHPPVGLGLGKVEAWGWSWGWCSIGWRKGLG